MLDYEDPACDNNNNNNEVVSNYNNFIATREYDRAITAAIQSNLYAKNLKKEQEEKEQHNQEKSIKKKTKIIMIVDNDSDTTLTFKKSLEAENDSSNNSIFLEVYTYNHPLLALSEFKQNFYDLLLIDINMQKMNGFELSTKILEIDPNPKICFMSSGEVNHEALREVYPAVNIGCFIKKPVTIDYLIRRVKAELE